MGTIDQPVAEQQKQDSGGKSPLQKRKHAITLLYLGLYLFAAFLLFYNLSDRMLWGDEAETALLARNIQKFGLPRIDDGRNVVSQYPEPWEANEDGIWTWNTWLPYYVAALSFKLFGENTFAARFPFALLALFVVFLMRKAARDLDGDEETALIATALLVFSVPFLLHARQCRYFSMLALGAIGVIIGYHRLVFAGKRRGGFVLAFALVFLFYSSFISCVGNAAGIALHALICRKRKETVRALFPYLSLAAFLLLPWVIYSGMLAKGGQTRLGGAPMVLLEYIQRMNFHIFPLVLLALPPVALLLRRVPLRQWIPSEKTLLLVLLIAGNLAVLSVFPFVYFRYLVIFLPALLLLEAKIIRRFAEPRALRLALVLLIAATNVPGIISLYPLRGGRTAGSPIAAYIEGITSDYEDKFENVLAFLDANALESESVALYDPGYPLMFYTRMKMIDARYPRNRDDVWKADWVLSESPAGVIDYGAASTLRVPESLENNYRALKLVVRDTPLGASRPDPDFHRFLSATRLKPLIIYRRIQ